MAAQVGRGLDRPTVASSRATRKKLLVASGCIFSLFSAANLLDAAVGRGMAWQESGGVGRTLAEGNRREVEPEGDNGEIEKRSCLPTQDHPGRHQAPGLA